MKDDVNIANKVQVDLNCRNIRVHMVWAAGSQSQLETAVLNENKGGCLETVEGTDIQVCFLKHIKPRRAFPTDMPVNTDTCTLES